MCGRMHLKLFGKLHVTNYNQFSKEFKEDNEMLFANLKNHFDDSMGRIKVEGI